MYPVLVSTHSALLLLQKNCLQPFPPTVVISAEFDMFITGSISKEVVIPLHWIFLIFQRQNNLWASSGHQAHWQITAACQVYCALILSNTLQATDTSTSLMLLLPAMTDFINTLSLWLTNISMNKNIVMILGNFAKLFDMGEPGKCWGPYQSSVVVKGGQGGRPPPSPQHQQNSEVEKIKKK